MISVSALAAAAALGALAAGTLAGGEDGRARLVVAADRELGSLSVVPVDRPANGSSAAVPLRGDGGQKLDFFQTKEPLGIESQTEEGATLQCPKGYRAVNGYYVTGRQGTFLDLSAPELASPPAQTETETKPSKRNWVIAVFNATGELDQVVFGVACLNKLG